MVYIVVMDVPVFLKEVFTKIVHIHVKQVEI
ncbi:hypothetical protein KSF78_0009736 [Schistosoma japonicum]|nr:hypothetical protein KSF78_0009736 [Schistosoma japonicum]